MKCSFSFLLILALAFPAIAQTTQPSSRPLFVPPATRPVVTTQPTTKAQRALIISVDGLRPDLLLRGNTPNLHALFESGSYSFWARTTEVSITLPSHVSMLTGVIPERHGINFNNDGPEDQEQIFPLAQTIFELAKQHGMTTSVVSGKSKFSALNKPGSVDWAVIPKRATSAKDLEVAEAAATIIRSHRPQVLFTHFGGVDGAGHGKGWGTPEQMEAIATADRAVGVLIDTLRAENLLDSTVIILSADHGGSGRSHGRDDPRARHIPWIAAGPGISKNLDLTRFKSLVINTEDTFATACWMLGLPVDSELDGRPVWQILESVELMSDAPSTKPTTQPAALTPTASN